MVQRWIRGRWMGGLGGNMLLVGQGAAEGCCELGVRGFHEVGVGLPWRPWTQQKDEWMNAWTYHGLMPHPPHPNEPYAAHRLPWRSWTS